MAEKGQLLRLNVASLLISVALDDGPGPPIKYQYAELAKLYQVVSTLVRCCDVSSLTQPFGAAEGSGPSSLPNPFLEPALQGESVMALQLQVDTDRLGTEWGRFFCNNALGNLSIRRSKIVICSSINSSVHNA